jgi:16S rRNA processing protein RimM
MKESLIKIGHTLKPHGLKGEIKVFVEEQYEEDLFQSETVFLEIAGRNIPYFIENIRGGNALIVKFEDINDIDAATKIANRALQLREKDIIPEEEKEGEIVESYSYLEGFYIIDTTNGKIAEIQSVIDTSHQELALLEYNGKEIFIPLHDDFIISIDETNKEVPMDLPEGILDL